MRSRAIARRCLALSAVAVALAGCGGDWAPSNPYDPGTPLQVRIVGPTVADALDDTVTFTVETTPAWQSDWPAMQVTWSTSEYLTSLGGGRFVVQTGDATTLRVHAAIGKHEATDSLLVRRRATRIAAFWCGGSDTVKTLSVSSYGPVSLCTHYFDRHGFEINPFWFGTVAFAQPLDGSLVSVSAGSGSTGATPLTITPLADGTTTFADTFQMAGSPTLTDTARLVVRQRIAGVIPSPCGTIIAVGDTLRLRIHAVDAAGVPFTKPPTNETWTVQSSASGAPLAASITSDGLLTAERVGDYLAIVNVSWTNEGVSQILSCYGGVR